MKTKEPEGGTPTKADLKAFDALSKRYTAKPKAPISFRIKRSPRTKQFRCVVRNEGNHEITLSGENCKNKWDVARTIIAHIEAILEGRYFMEDEEGEIFFTTRGWEKAPKPIKFDPADWLPKKTKCCGKGCKKPKHYSGKINRNWP